jgi:hypothetical protein
MDHDFMNRGYLLPEGCKDLIDVFKLKPGRERRRPSPPSAAVTWPLITGELVVPAQTSASTLAALLNQESSRIIADVMQLGVSVDAGQQLDFWIVLIVSRKYGFLAKKADEQSHQTDLCVIPELDLEQLEKRVMAQLGKRAVYRGTGHLVPVTIEAINSFPEYFSAELMAVDGITLSYSKKYSKLPCKFSVAGQWQQLTEGRNNWAGCYWQLFLDEAKCDVIVQLYKQNTEMDPDLFFKLAKEICYKHQIKAP